MCAIVCEDQDARCALLLLSLQQLHSSHRHTPLTGKKAAAKVTRSGERGRRRRRPVPLPSVLPPVAPPPPLFSTSFSLSLSGPPPSHIDAAATSVLGTVCVCFSRSAFLPTLAVQEEKKTLQPVWSSLLRFRSSSPPSLAEASTPSLRRQKL